jgi:glycosyltransferase involved in cell wall biosynthesis
MSSFKPLVSIIIPAYNASKFITDAINSIHHQTYTNYEIIIVDDGSADGTIKIVENFGDKVQLVQQEHGGIGKARNAGIAKAHGKLIAFLDADDVWLPTKLEEQIQYLEVHPEIDIVFSLAQNTYDPMEKNNTKDGFPVIQAHVPPSCLFRVELLDKVGLFDTSITLGEFADWYGRIVNAKIGIGCVNSLLVLRRIHGENIGIREKNNQIEYVRILKRKIDQAKAASS